MKLLLLSDGNSIHTIRWALALEEQGISIGLFSLDKLNHTRFVGKNIDVCIAGSGTTARSHWSPIDLRKTVYLAALPKLKRFIKTFQPDILHAHFASSYGLLGALSGFQPLVISVWGYDVFDFPRKNFLFKSIFKYNLSRARQVLSTSIVMAKETERYTSKSVIVTPFGVDLSKFYSSHDSGCDKPAITIGTVKSLESKYGIDLLLRAFANVRKKFDTAKLVIAGEGSQMLNLKKLADELNVSQHVAFLGRLDHEIVPDLLRTFNIYVALSRQASESFGVAIVEAQACGIPVIVSNMGGLPEVVEANVTGLIVENESVESAAQALETLMADRTLRQSMGNQGIERVKRLYDWNKNVQHMCEIYKKLLKR